MRANLIEVVMGAVVLVVAIVFIAFAYSSSQLQPVQGYNITAKFDRIDGLIRGSDIKMSGVKIGTVTDVILDPKSYLAVVTLTLNPNIKVPVDTAAEIVGDGLLGSKFLALVPGGEDDLIPEGGEIQHTQSSISLEALIGKFIYNSDAKDESKK
ncbi:Outer membrane lipid asymmetry maintenance protein MlaD [Candidatus Bealeia paramacronuclearis]|uniref:Outer membrane lipid asymmetry maintenance protein MlaD n=2 Tax=Candidatus Bealeia paramacronuclearis TaxID=1921001 RepID=A0ABZ2C3Q4_9PROT|nr:Outer membrane lipid asymmetry maintenance protein MlaD [Candidatus Bealeia paramacronuclearis]